jgi:predicted Zn-ribbon and HTH transcriptional regulator
MGPTKVIVKGEALHDVKTGKLIKEGLLTAKERNDFAARHYVVLPVQDKLGRAWEFEGGPVYCLHGSVYETANDQIVRLSRCPDCGGMAIRTNEVSIERDCILCTQCHHEFDSRLEMMES